MQIIPVHFVSITFILINPRLNNWFKEQGDGRLCNFYLVSWNRFFWAPLKYLVEGLVIPCVIITSEKDK